MFGRYRHRSTPSRFWRWFASEAEGLANALEALQRGEADAEGALGALNNHIRQVDPGLEADVIRALDGRCQLMLSGPDEGLKAVLQAAPVIDGWNITRHEAVADNRRVPFRITPSPSLDRLGMAADQWEACAG